MSLWDKRAIGTARDVQIDDKDVPYMFSPLNRNRDAFRNSPTIW
jgi:hypothetical protein